MTEIKKSNRGFASLSAARRSEISRMGGAATKTRAFSTDPELASRAGRMGGIASGKTKAARRAAAKVDG